MVDFQSRDTRKDERVDDESDTEEEMTDDEEVVAQSEGTAPAEEPGYAIVTVATNRTLSSDQPGAAVERAIQAAGETVVSRELIQPSYDGIQNAVTTMTERSDVAAVVTVGGTGVEPDDVAVDAVEALYEKRLPGFGELFRLLAHDERGTAVIGTRTTAGMINSIPVFAVPGTTDGALMATEQIIIHEAHSLREAAKSEE